MSRRERLYLVCVPTRGHRAYMVTAASAKEAAAIVNDRGDDACLDPRVARSGGSERVSGKANYVRVDGDD